MAANPSTPASSIPTSTPAFDATPSNPFKATRWNIMVEQGTVIPLESLPLDPLVFQQRVAQALYQLAKDNFDLRRELKETKESVKKAKKRGKTLTFEEEPQITVTGNAFDLLGCEDE